MSDDAANKTCAFDVCQQCALGCCRDVNPPLTVERKKKISKYLQENGLRREKLFVDAAYSSPSVDATGLCLFYCKDTGKCQVHPVKPETCRAGPVTFDINLHSRKVEWFLKKTEVCALAERLCENKDLFKAHFEVAKAELLRLIHELDSEALRALMLIEEPQTSKIGEDILPKEALEKLELV
jgi:Fe-S-cluster containining protein